MSEALMRLLDARRLLDNQFTDKAINSADTKKKMVDEIYNQGFIAVPEGGYGFAIEAGEVVTVYAASC